MQQFDLLQLSGVSPIGQRTGDNCVIVVAVSNVLPPEKCPSCGLGPLYKHGSRTYSYADTPMYGKPIKVEIERQRYRCKACGKVETPDIPSLDDKRVATKRLVGLIQSKCFKHTFTALSEETGLALNTVKSVAVDYLNWLDESQVRETPRIMGLDEVKLAGKYRAVVTNLEMKTVFEMYERRTKQHMIDFFKALKNKDNVEWVGLDMWGAFKIVLRDHLPDAKLVIDRYHVVEKARSALDKFRIHIQSELEKDARVRMKKGLRWGLLRRNEKRTQEDDDKLDYIRTHYPELGVAYDLAEAFHDLYEIKGRANAEAAFEAWQNSIPEEFMPHFGPIASMVNRHHEDIFNYFDFPITNAYTEAMNGVIKIANRMGRGYSYDIIRARLLYAKVGSQTGRVITHSGTPKSITDPVTTWGDTKVVDYGRSISSIGDD